MSLYHKYRPKTLEELSGNKQTITTLNKMLSDSEKTPHTYLLTGPTGCGKTTIARIIATRLNSTGSDFREINSADFRGIETVRDIIKQIRYQPLESACRVWLIDECHKMTGDAQNAMLKILEDTPNHVYFILCTTEPHKLIATIKNRCSVFTVEPLSDLQMRNLLKKIAKAENEIIKAKVLDQIILDSLGHARQAIQILEQVLAVEPELRLKVAKKSAEEQSQSIELCRALMKGGIPWKSVSNILKGIKEQDPENTRRHVLGYAQSVLLNGDQERAGLILEEFIEPFYTSGFPGLVLACYMVVKN